MVRGLSYSQPSGLLLFSSCTAYFFLTVILRSAAHVVKLLTGTLGSLRKGPHVHLPHLPWGPQDQRRTQAPTRREGGRWSPVLGAAGEEAPRVHLPLTQPQGVSFSTWFPRLRGSLHPQIAGNGPLCGHLALNLLRPELHLYWGTARVRFTLRDGSPSVCVFLLPLVFLFDPHPHLSIAVK